MVGVVMASKLPEPSEAMKGQLAGRNFRLGHLGCRFTNMKSRGWPSMAKQNQFLLSRGQRGRKITVSQALTTSSPILPAMML